jgi:predicted TPR repeat methyltransferase
MTVSNYYDDQAQLTGWLGPEVLFGLAYGFVLPGETVLDIGIGTGLGSVLFAKAGLRVFGMDSSEEMLGICRQKGFCSRLVPHDLTSTPYPFADGSIDHMVCVGVLNFFEKLSPVFREAGRLLRDGGLFAFSVGARDAGEPAEMLVGPEYTGSPESVTMYRHSTEQIRALSRGNGVELFRDVEFPSYMDADRTVTLRGKAYVGRRMPRV